MSVSCFSGDQFVLIVNAFQEVEDARVIAQKVLQAFVDPFDAAGYEMFVSTSIGISIYASDNEDEHSLLQNADAAMYRAM